MSATAGVATLPSPALERAGAYVEGCVARGEIAGAVAIVVGRDQEPRLTCLGMRDIDAGLPMEPDTIFQIASMTKPITAVAALMLVEAGRLRLDDPVSHFIPEFADPEVFAGVEDGSVILAPLARPITIEHLLMQTSGLAREAPHPTLEPMFDNMGDYDYALPELMRRLAAHPLAHQPGEGWIYASGYNVLGRVIEVAGGQPLDEYLASAIFTPLGMVDSGFFVPPAKVDRLAVVYEHESTADILRRVDDPDTYEVTGHVPLLSGSGGCVATAIDYLRFARMLQRRGEFGGVRLLKPETVDLITRNHLAPPLLPIRPFGHALEGEGYGLGVGISLDPATEMFPGTVGTYGWAGSWGTRFWIDPATGLAGVFMVQSDPFAFVGPAEAFWSLACGAMTD